MSCDNMVLLYNFTIKASWAFKSIGNSSFIPCISRASPPNINLNMPLHNLSKCVNITAKMLLINHDAGHMLRFV